MTLFFFCAVSRRGHWSFGATTGGHCQSCHIAVTYWSLTPGPHQQWWMPRAVPFFARMALELLPAAGVL